jgi:ABC-type multidrug transport system permease subunit
MVAPADEPAFPLTYTVEGIRAAFSAAPSSSSKDLLLLAVFLMLFLLPAMRMLRKRFE